MSARVDAVAGGRGALALSYTDEVRFSRPAPVPYAWQYRAEPPVGLPAERGAGGGHSVLGLWRPGVAAQPFIGLLSDTAFTAELVGGALDEFSEPLTQAMGLVLDNASIHRAALVHTRPVGGLRLACACCFCRPTRPNSTALKFSGPSANTTGCRPRPIKHRKP